MTISIRLHPQLSKCHKCHTYSNTQSIHPNFIDCTMVQCVNCFAQWCVYVDHNICFTNKTLYKLQNHFLHAHVVPVTSNHDDSVNGNFNKRDIPESLTDDVYQFVHEESDDDISILNNDKQQYKKLKSNNNIILPHSFDISNPDNYIYSPSVIKKLIGTAFSNNQWTPLNVTNQEMDFQLNLTDYCCALTESKQHQLTLLLQLLVSSDFKTTRPPTTYNDLRTIYLSGKHSIYKNINVPKVSEFDDHAYVSIKTLLNFH